MRKLFLALPILFAACSNTSTVQSNLSSVQAACAVDGILQPIAVATVTALVPAGAAVVAADGTVHAAIQAFCAQSGAVAVALVAKPTTTVIQASPATAARVKALSAPAAVAP